MTHRSDLLQSLALSAAADTIRKATAQGQIDPNWAGQDNRTSFRLALLDVATELDGRAALIRTAPEYENDKERMGRMLITAQTDRKGA